ncbi:MFS transporter [Laceyella sacchari]|uniref:MFS transporter n=1 Tax=Laceyella sacchari TaxID=37482 RepID=A0ABY5UAI1_LACSH|nr:MFS transporter [Laceyella sacchari]UWE05088.1 MFS transporter [Laceyella sacchari]
MKRNRSFHCLWVGQTMANLGDSFFILAMVTLIYQMTGLTLVAALFPLFRVIAVSMSGTVAPLLFGRFHLQRILFISQASQTVLLAVVVALVFVDGKIEGMVPLLLVLTFVISFLDGWTTPTRNALVPRLVEDGELVEANSLLSTMDQIALLTGWSVGGGILSVMSEAELLSLTWILFAVSTVSTLFIKDRSKVEPKRSSGRWNQIKSGWVNIWNSPAVRIVTAIDLLIVLGAGIWTGAVILVFVNQVLHKGAFWWGIINTGYFAGTMVAGFVILSISKWVSKHIVASMAIGLTGMVLFTFSFSFTTLPWLALTLITLLGPMFQIRRVAQQTILQRNTTNETYPEIASAHYTMLNILYAVSVLLMGYVTDVLGVRYVYWITTVFYILCLILIPQLHRLIKAQPQSSKESR